MHDLQAPERPGVNDEAVAGAALGRMIVDLAGDDGGPGAGGGFVGAIDGDVAAPAAAPTGSRWPARSGPRRSW